MADVKNIVTLGIGAAPGKLLWFITGGLETAAAAVVTGIVDLHLHTRAQALTLETRSPALTVHTRTPALTLEDR